MSNYNAAYEAAKNGADWSYVINQYGDSNEVRTAYEKGRSVYKHSEDSPEAAMGESFGNLMALWMMLVAVFYIFVVLYSPLLLIAFVLLYPFLPPLDVLKESTDLWVPYGGLAISFAYILSCAFEYLRARMLEARLKNRKWKWLFVFIFSFRILFPGLIVYLCIYIWYGDKLFYLALAIVLMLLWKVKILDPKSRFYFTGWAFKEGVRSMAHLPSLEPALPEITGSPADKFSLLRRFYVTWLALTTVSGMALFSIISDLYPGHLWLHGMSASIFLILSFCSASLIAKRLMDKGHEVFGINNLAERVVAPDWIVLTIAFFASLPMVFDFVKDFSTFGMMLVFAAVGGILVRQRIRKERRMEEALTEV